MLTLAGCASSSRVQVAERELAPVPADIKVCFSTTYKLPPGANYTKAQVVEIIASLIKQDKVKSACGKRLIAWYEAQS